MVSVVTGRSLSPSRTGSRDCSRSQRGSFREECPLPTTMRDQDDPSPERHEMRCYTGQHRFYCGVDLHSRNMHVHILNRKCQTVFEQDLPADPAAFETTNPLHSCGVLPVRS